eukprot:GHUV01028025.1.p1 GENE.GHUV01028025.1~~GHUV01028025.1.p1  ORF type:complete len:221 (+),score=40.17 GHUV01028025.1:154-816(+)
MFSDQALRPVINNYLMQARQTSRCVAVKGRTRRAVQCVASAARQDAHQHKPFISRRQLVGTAGLLTAGAAGAAAAAAAEEERRGERVIHSDAEWRSILTSGQYKILREAGTELPGSSPLNSEKRRGKFVCAGCGAPLFSSAAKFNSGTGWPSFYEPLPGAVAETLDTSIFFYPRTEVRCKACGGHLGHVFDDGPAPTGLRYCMNGLALEFKPAGDAAPQA